MLLLTKLCRTIFARMLGTEMPFFLLRITSKTTYFSPTSWRLATWMALDRAPVSILARSLVMPQSGNDTYSLHPTIVLSTPSILHGPALQMNRRRKSSSVWIGEFNENSKYKVDRHSICKHCRFGHKFFCIGASPCSRKVSEPSWARAIALSAQSK